MPNNKKPEKVKEKKKQKQKQAPEKPAKSAKPPKPNAGLDTSPRKKQKQKRRAFCLIWCADTERLLMEKRRPTSDNVPVDVHVNNEYGLFGGGADKKETPLQNIQRELHEEIGIRFESFDYAVTVPGTKTTIFVKIVEREFKPTLSVESAGFRWVHDFLDVRPLHSVVAQNYSLLRRLVVAAGKRLAEVRGV